MANATVNLTKSQTRRLTSGTWQEWKAGTANEIIPFYLAPDTPYITYRSESEQELACFKVGTVLDLISRLTTVTVTLRFKNTSTNAAITIHPFLRLYNGTDPSGGSTAPGYYPQTGLLANGDISQFSVPAGGTVDKTYSFTGISTTVDTLHVLLSLGMQAAKTTNGYIQVITQNCTFTGTGPERVASITVMPASVKTGENTTIRVYGRGGRTFTVNVKYGNTVLHTYTIDSDSMDITIPKSWFTAAGVTALEYFTTSFELSNGDIWEVNIRAGEDMKPVVDTPTVTIVQPSPASDNYPNTFLAGVSKAHVAVTVTSGSNSAISGVRCFYDGGNFSLTYNSSTGKWEGDTPSPVTQSTTFRINATDQRGLVGVAESAQITVVPYTQPAIVIDTANTYRCNSSGAKVDGGAYYRVKATATVCTEGDLSGNQVEEFVVYISGDTTEIAIQPGAQSGPLNGALSSSTGYTFYVRLKDSVGYETLKSFRLEGSRRFIVLQSNGKGIGVGIGKNPRWVGDDLNYLDLNVLSNKESSYETSSGSNLLLSGLRINEMRVGGFHEFITALFTGVTFGKDFLNIGTERTYTQENGTVWFIKPTDDSEWAGMPNTMVGKYWVGVRFVLRKASTTALVIIIEWTPQPGRIWINQLSTDGWRGWKYLTPTAES